MSHKAKGTQEQMFLWKKINSYLEIFFCYSPTFFFLQATFPNIAPEFFEILCSSIPIHRVFSSFLYETIHFPFGVEHNSLTPWQ